MVAEHFDCLEYYTNRCADWFAFGWVIAGTYRQYWFNKAVKCQRLRRTNRTNCRSDSSCGSNSTSDGMTNNWFVRSDRRSRQNQDKLWHIVTPIAFICMQCMRCRLSLAIQPPNDERNSKRHVWESTLTMRVVCSLRRLFFSLSAVQRIVCTQ